ncbi:MAG: acylphosphatase [Planctomycetota bacterium]
MIKTIYVIIRGRVQGVGYRYATAKKANQFQIVGWVRNRDDGTVDGIFQGEESALHEMLKWCDHGPANAVVEEVQVYPKEEPSLFSQFDIIH